MLLVVPALSFPGSLSSQAPLRVAREFVLTAPGPGVANAVIALRRGGFVAVGYADFGGARGTDVLLVRFDAAGDTLWTRSYGGEREDFGWDVVESPDGGFFIVGFTEAPAAGREDVLVLRVADSGELVWEQSFGASGRDRAWSVTLATDGDIVIAAEREDGASGTRDAYVMRLDSAAVPRWTRALAVPGDQRVFQVTRTDGAFVFAGTTAPDSRATRDLYVVRLEADGRVGWTRSFGEAPDDVGHGVVALAGGDVLVTGYGGTRSEGGRDVYLLRLGPDGDLRWWRHHGGPDDDRAMMSTPTGDRGIVTVGFSITPSGSDIMVLESDSGGSVLGQTVLERPGDDRGVMVLATGDGEYVVAGTLGGSRTSGGDFAVLWLTRTGGRDP